MSNPINTNFNFIKILNEEKTYKLLFPEREIGLAIVLIYEKINDGVFEDEKFTENDLHEAFENIYKTKERYPKEVYSSHIMDLQEYFLDYNQETQKYFFKDYASKFCKHAKETLIGAFNPTRIQEICSFLSNSLLESEDSTDKLKFWLKETFKKFEPDLREQIDFLDRQITESIELLKKGTDFTNQNFLNILVATDFSMNKAQKHVAELRSAYSETKTIRGLLEQKQNQDNEINELISEVYSFVKYINDRLSSIDRKLDRIQPKIRQLFSTLSKPLLSSKIEKFIHLLLDKSTLESNSGNKSIVFPHNIISPQIHIPTPHFTIIDKDRELFPSKPKERKQYIQNEKVIEENIKKAQDKINEIDTIRNWEKYILSEIELKGSIKLSEVFFKIIEESKSSQIAVSVTFNIIKYVYSNKDKYKLEIDKELETNSEFKNIALWKMKIIKLV
ncbi:hypothetical protein [Flavobacterium sp.]|uniref:hypothetical protein n=1 Tax=Flavobacterium sp. TaxID=239 RepID=UPI00286E3D85|nr:hypothetical protein [Flavobacterium sp.]